MRVAHGDPTEHLPATTVAAYLQGKLDGTGRSTAEAHLASCAACRHEAVAVAQLMAARRRERIMGPALGVVAAAVLALAVGLPKHRPNVQAAVGDPVRAPAPAPAAAISTITPAPDTVLPAGGAVRFAWHAAPGGSRYRVMLLGETGELLWSTETGDTVAPLPHDVRLAPAGSYFWYVDALSTDGATRTSGARRFSLR